ncbi:hypothetical protein EVAR_33939_1 [Eumeta japonica]|uniref:Uncharacterized protein n=1 Tax=Eumeta variegata TaxID=151549 RepID=A0A4C1VX63_EUMVA|nr:hypothetical protein EVAR_33939_1 [Eumeta japonica]
MVDLAVDIMLREIRSYRLDCGDEGSQSDKPSFQEGTGKGCFGTLTVCGWMDDETDDIHELTKDKRFDILYVNETKRKGSGGVIEYRSFHTVFWR